MLDTDLRPLLEMRQQIKERTLATIAYADLWNLFEHGQDVITSQSNSQVYRVLRWTGGRDPLAKHSLWAELQARAALEGQSAQVHENRGEALIVECHSYEFDGNNYGPMQKTFTIQKYEGERPITSLPVYPLEFAPGWKDIRQRLIVRGDLYIQLSRADKVTHKHYTGLTLDEPRHEVSSLIKHI